MKYKKIINILCYLGMLSGIVYAFLASKDLSGFFVGFMFSTACGAVLTFIAWRTDEDRDPLQRLL